ncbi:hypothetical protein K439DRAFT_1648864 [Ramaria rubella]|nr:hypothetical protein K439DRAFT_1648864 [Ramaria rubella]
MLSERILRCGVCTSEESKYSCPACLIPYCSVKCFKEHKAIACLSPGPIQAATMASGPRTEVKPTQSEEEVLNAPVLRPLTSLKWPYIPEESSFADPLKRDEPKALQLHQYEAIATSSAIRSALSSTNLPVLLRRIDKLRGSEREEALESLLGVTVERISPHRRQAWPNMAKPDENIRALKEFAEAVEKAVRGEKADALGLDWVEDS